MVTLSPNSQVNHEELDRYTHLVRNYLQDYAENNVLLADTEEFSDKLIKQNILMAIDLFNMAIGHMTKYHLEKFPVPTILILGASGLCLTSGGVLQTRNHFTISDGGLGGPLSEKTDYYKSWGESLLNQFVTFSNKFKESVNVEGGYNTISSSYLCAYSDILRGK